eukprot:scaffold17097_cov21-Tisochrysis_lutea.AAC.5
MSYYKVQVPSQVHKHIRALIHTQTHISYRWLKIWVAAPTLPHPWSALNTEWHTAKASVLCAAPLAAVGFMQAAAQVSLVDPLGAILIGTMELALNTCTCKWRLPGGRHLLQATCTVHCQNAACFESMYLQMVPTWKTSSGVGTALPAIGFMQAVAQVGEAPAVEELISRLQQQIAELR